MGSAWTLTLAGCVPQIKPERHIEADLAGKYDCNLSVINYLGSDAAAALRRRPG